MKNLKKTLLLGGLSIASLAQAENNMAGLRTIYNVQTGRFQERVEGYYNNGTIYGNVTMPIGASIKDASASTAEISMTTGASTLNNKIAKHILPRQTYTTFNLGGDAVGFGVQWATPKLGNDKFGISANAWAIYYENMMAVQTNVKPDVKKSALDGGLVFAAKALCPDNIKTNILAANDEIKVAGVELLWSGEALKQKMDLGGMISKTASKAVPSAVFAAVDGKGRMKNVGLDYNINF
jgi:hypothetical protein